MKKRLVSAILVIVLACSIMMCSCSDKTEYPVMAGSVLIEAEPQNIVILGENLADIISCIGYDVKMVGRSDAVTQKGLQVVPSVGDENEPDVELIKKYGADVVFAESSISESVKEEIEKSGIPVAIIEDAQTPKQLKSMYKKIGKILGGNITGKAKATQAVKDLLSTLETIKDAVASESVVKTMCYLYVDNGILKTMNNGTWGAQLLDYTGAVNVFENSDSVVVDSEILLRSNPDCIFCANEDVVNYLNSSEVYKNLDALNENTCVVDYSDMGMQGMTALDVIKTMLQKMYPQQFSE